MDKGKKPVGYDEEDEEPIRIEVSGEEVSDVTVSLCLLGKLWTERPYNSYGLMETMKKLWCPSKGMICRDMGANLISFQFNNKRDMERVLAMEPWHFNKHILVLSRISNQIQPSMMKFDKTPFWIRIYDVPIAAKNESVLKQIGNRFGEVVEIDSTTTKGITRSVRIKIIIDLSKPLKRGTKLCIGSGSPCWIPVTYERLPSFCYWCGRLGHTTKDCELMPEPENQEHQVSETEMPFGEFLKASPIKHAQIMMEREKNSYGDIRRSLFHKKQQKHIFDEGNATSKTQGVEVVDDTSTEMTQLLQSLKKVDVGDKPKELEASMSTKPSHLPSTRPDNITTRETHKAPAIPHVASHDTQNAPQPTNQKPQTEPKAFQPPQKPNQLHNHQKIVTNPEPITPLSVLIDIVNNQNPMPIKTTMKENTPHINQGHPIAPQTKAKVKIEPPSPQKKQHLRKPKSAGETKNVETSKWTQSSKGYSESRKLRKTKGE